MQTKSNTKNPSILLKNYHSFETAFGIFSLYWQRCFFRYILYLSPSGGPPCRLNGEPRAFNRVDSELGIGVSAKPSPDPRSQFAPFFFKTDAHSQWKAVFFFFIRERALIRPSRN